MVVVCGNICGQGGGGGVEHGCLDHRAWTSWLLRFQQSVEVRRKDRLVIDFALLHYQNIGLRTGID